MTAVREGLEAIMAVIDIVHAGEIRGHPTIEAEVAVDDGTVADPNR